MKLTVIGVGPGDPELLTVKAVKRIENAKLIFVPVKKEGSKDSTVIKIAKCYINDMTKVHYMYFPMIPMDKHHEYLDEVYKRNSIKMHNIIKSQRNVVLNKDNRINSTSMIDISAVFLTLGDPMIYSTFTYLKPYFEFIEYIPGIPSFIGGASLVGIPLCIGKESFAVVNMTDQEKIIRNVFRIHDSIVVMKVSSNQELLKELIINGNRQVTFMSNIGLENETVTSKIDYLNGRVPYFTIGIVR